MSAFVADGRNLLGDLTKRSENFVNRGQVLLILISNFVICPGKVQIAILMLTNSRFIYSKLRLPILLNLKFYTIQFCNIILQLSSFSNHTFFKCPNISNLGFILLHL